MIYYLREDEEQYNVSPTRKHLLSLVGDKATKKLYDAFGNSNCILRASSLDYRNAGLTELQVDRLVAAKEMAMEPEMQIKCSEDAYHHFTFLLHEQVEHFYVLVLNRANKVMRKVEVSIGGTSGTVVDVKVLYRKVLAYAAVNSIIIVHNHPSGNLKPSQADLDVTQKIVEAGKLLDIKILDHLIVGNNEQSKYLSFADEGYM